MVARKKAKTGLYANINAKRQRIDKGSGEKMRKPGDEGAPTAQAFEESAKTAKPARTAKKKTRASRPAATRSSRAR